MSHGIFGHAKGTAEHPCFVNVEKQIFYSCLHELDMLHYIEFSFGDFAKISFGKSYRIFFWWDPWKMLSKKWSTPLALVMVQTTLHFHELTFLTELSGIRNEFVRQFSSAVKRQFLNLKIYNRNEESIILRHYKKYQSTIPFSILNFQI